MNSDLLHPAKRPAAETAARPRGRPRLDAVARRDRIVSTAVEMFTRQGYADTKLEDVARAVGVTKRTIYELVGDKETLFHTACARSFASIADFSINIQQGERDLRACLTDMAHRLIHHALSDEVISTARMMVFEGNRFPDLMQQVIHAGKRGLNARIGTFFAQLVELGMIPAVVISDASDVFFDVIVGNRAFRRSLGYDEDWPSEAQIETRVAVFLNGYIASIAAR